MLSTVVVAWRTMVKRMVADWLIVGAAFTTVLLAVALLASGPIYADAVTISALQRTLADAPVTDSALTARVDVFPDYYEEADDTVRVTVANALSATGADVFAHVEAEAFGFADRPVDGVVDLPSFQYFEGIDERASIVDGRWPSDGGTTHETALNAPAADALGLGVGDSIEVASRRDPSFQTMAVIVGVYEVEDPTDPFWFQDGLALRGQVESGMFRSFGPFVVTLETMLTGFTPQRIGAGWRVLPDYEQLTVSEVNGLGASVAGLENDLNLALFSQIDRATTGSSEYTVKTGLAELAAGVNRSLTVTRSSVLSLLVQLALLAGYALVLTAGLLVGTRRTDTALLRSRGASPGQVLATSLLEGLALTVPAVILGPYVATWLLRILNAVGPLAAIGLRIEPMPTSEAYVLAVLASALSLVALTWPALRAARSFPEGGSKRDRQRTRSATQRLGVDLALVALAVIAFWQLQELGSQIGARVRGRFGVDPLLVLAPALGLLAGAVLALRIVPLLARIAERLAAAGRWAVSALASWQVARRPVRYARSSLLLMMAISIGFFAASYSTTWISSQRDQAAHVTGADIRVVPSMAVASSLDDVVLESAHLSVDGVDESMPVARFGGQVGPDVGLGRFLLLDASKATRVVEIRSDIAPDFADLMDSLVTERPEVATVPLPGEPTAITLDLEAEEEIPEPEDLPGVAPEDIEIGFNALVSLILQDGNGLLHRVVVDRIPVNDGTTRLTVDLTADLAGDSLARPAYPLSLVNVEIQSQVPSSYSRDVLLDFIDIGVTQADGSWEPAPMSFELEDVAVSTSQVAFVNRSPVVRPTAPSRPGVLTLQIETGEGFGTAPAYFSVRPSGTTLPETFPVVVSEALVESGFVDLGQVLAAPQLRLGNARAVVAGTVASFPTVRDDTETALVVDLPTYQMLDYEPGFGLDRVDEYWLSVSGEPEAVLASLETPPLNSFATEGVEELVDELVSDPVALGTIGALTVGFVAAAVFAAVGFAVSATVSARERLVEFALLRALGLSPRQLGSWLVLEQGALVVASLVLGTAVGVLLTAVILPLITLTQSGGPAVPDVIVVYPWRTVVVLEVSVLAVLAAIVAILTSVLRRVGLGSMLRLGED